MQNKKNPIGQLASLQLPYWWCEYKQKTKPLKVCSSWGSSPVGSFSNESLELFGLKMIYVWKGALFLINVNVYCVFLHLQGTSFGRWPIAVACGIHKCTGCSALRFHTRLQNGITPKIAQCVVDSLVSIGHAAWCLNYLPMCLCKGHLHWWRVWWG